MKTCAAPAASKVKFNMKIHLPAGKALKAQIAAMKATKARAPTAIPKTKFNMKIHLPVAAGKALKAEIAAMKATKAIAKDVKKAVAKDSKKAIDMDTKKDNFNDGNEGQEVLDLYIENLDLVKRDPSNINTGVSSKAVSKIEKTFSNLSMDQV